MEAHTFDDSAGVSWPWAERARARIAELNAQLEIIRYTSHDGQNNRLNCAFKNLEGALAALDGRTHRWRKGACIDRVESSMNAVSCTLVRLSPPEQLRGKLPEILAAVRSTLPRDDPRRLAVEDIATADASLALSDVEREKLAGALRAAYVELEREHVRVRSFRRIVLATAAVLAVIAVAIGLLGALAPKWAQLCYGANPQVCVTGLQPSAGDFFFVELFGLAGASLAAAASIRRIRGTSTPYDVPSALALLKLPSGAITAVLGLWLITGGYVTGIASPQTSGQLVAWSIVLGYAQQIFTRWVDERGQTVMDSVAPGDVSRAARRPSIPAPAAPVKEGGAPDLGKPTASDGQSSPAPGPAPDGEEERP